MSNRSRTYLLLEARLGRSLQEHVISARRAGQSWNAIALDLHVRTEVAITAESLRIWFFDEDKALQAELGADARTSA